MVSAAPSMPRLPNLLKEHPDTVAALACAALVLVGWQTLNLGLCKEPQLLNDWKRY